RVLDEIVDERVRYLRFTDLRGRVLQSRAATVSGNLEPLFLAGFRAAAESLAGARHGGPEATHADPVLLPGNPRSAALLITAPVVTGGRFVGVVSALVDLQSVWDSVMDGHGKEPYAIYAVDATGRLFAARNLDVDPGRDMADAEIVKRFRDNPGRVSETMPF